MSIDVYGHPGVRADEEVYSDAMSEGEIVFGLSDSYWYPESLRTVEEHLRSDDDLRTVGNETLRNAKVTVPERKLPNLPKNWGRNDTTSPAYSVADPTAHGYRL